MVTPPDPPLSDHRLALRPFRPEDAPSIVAASVDHDITRFTMMPTDLSLDGALAWIDRSHRAWADHETARFAITLPPDEEAVGQVGIGFEGWARRAEAFYWVHASARRRHVASAALELVTCWAFDTQDVVRVHLTTMVDNLASQRVAARAGFEREGILRRWMPVRDGQPDLVMWSRVQAVTSAGDAKL